MRVGRQVAGGTNAKKELLQDTQLSLEKSEVVSQNLEDVFRRAFFFSQTSTFVPRVLDSDFLFTAVWPTQPVTPQIIFLVYKKKRLGGEIFCITSLLT